MNQNNFDPKPIPDEQFVLTTPRLQLHAPLRECTDEQLAAAGGDLEKFLKQLTEQAMKMFGKSMEIQGVCAAIAYEQERRRKRVAILLADGKRAN